MNTHNRVVIAGASLGGLSAANALRSGGYDGQITLIDSSPELPTDRPPLSKGVLSGAVKSDATAQPLAAKLGELEVDLRLATRLVSLDISTRSVSVETPSGEELTVSGDAIIVATGAQPKTFGLGEGLAGVHALRDLSDALALRSDLMTTRRLVVVGAGFIGAEVAATARSMGIETTMVEAEQTPMARVFESEIGQWIADLHRNNGVDVRLGTGVAALGGTERVERVELVDGTSIEADTVVLGLGVSPSVGWLEGSGLDLADGIICDHTLRCAEGVFAAGDVASWYNEIFGEQMRVEHWDLAIEAGAAAARGVLAELAGEDAAPFTPVPWFWSDQYDAKIQMAGRCRFSDHVEIIERDDDERRLVAAFRRGDRCAAVLGVNRPRHVIKAKMAMAKSLLWDDVLEVIT